VSRALRQLVGFLLAAGLVAIFLYYFRNDLAAAVDEIRHALIPYLLLSVAFQIVHLLIRAYRWRLLLSPVKQDVGFYNLFSTTVIGYMASILFPFRVGEFIRPLMLAGRERISRGSALATVGVERVLDFLMVVGFLATYLLFFVDDLHAGARGSESWARMIAGARLAGMALLLVLPAIFLFARYGEAILTRIEQRLAGRRERLMALVAGTRRFAHGMRALTQPGLLIGVLVTSVGTWLAIAGATWAGVLAMDASFEFPFQATLLLVPFLAVGVATPSPGGAGGYHIICSLALEQLFGATGSAAAATAIMLWFLAWTPMVAMGFFFLWRAGLSLHHLKEMARPSRGASSPLDPPGAVREGDPT
jgi:uncharacterized protein (TIRG00374 family)